MRAIRYHELGDPSVLQVEELDRPSPGRDDVLVEMQGMSVNPVDAKFRSGVYGDVSLPSIPGGDGAGIVRDVGERVDRFEPGDRVVACGMGHAAGGTFAEYVAFPHIKLARLPADTPMDVGAAIGNVGATAYTALVELAAIGPGDRCLIHGAAGGVGHVAVQIAAAAGCEVIGTVGFDAAHEAVADLGADVTLDYDTDDMEAEITATTDGAGVDMILDHMLDQYLDIDLAVAANGATVVTITGDIPATSGAPLRNNEVTVRGMSMGNRPDRRVVLRRLMRLLDQERISVAIADRYTFDEVAAAHQDVLDGGYVGKLIVEP